MIGLHVDVRAVILAVSVATAAVVGGMRGWWSGEMNEALRAAH